MTASQPFPLSDIPVYEVPLSLLDEPDRNPNVMAPDQFEMLVEAIRTLGFKQPILARPSPTAPGRFIIVDGVHRSRAAYLAGRTTIPTELDTDTAPGRPGAIQLSMNRIRGEINLAEAARSLAELVEVGWSRDSLTLTGFSTEEIGRLLDTTHRATPEELLEGTVGNVREGGAEPEDGARKFTLELVFESREELARARSALRRAAGKNGTLGAGVLRILAELS